MMVKAILFDIDGTLVDSNGFHVDAWQEAFRSESLNVDREAIRGQIGKGSDMLIPALAPDADEALRKRLEEAHGRIFKGRYLDRVRPFPEARELLVRVHEAGKKVVLASSASKEELDHYVALLDVAALLAAATSADDVSASKPAPDIFGAALEKLAPLAPEEALVVGDTPYDVEAARKCGIPALALRSGGFPEDSLEEAGAIAIADDVSALLTDYEASPLAK